MPNDATLYPGIPNPQQQIIQRQGSLEARVAALEAKRDLVVTPFSFLTGGSASIPYYGGRLWLMAGGKLINTSGATGQTQLGMDMRINGVGAIGMTGDWVLTVAATGSPNAAAAFPLKIGEFSRSVMAAVYSAAPGTSLTITSVATFNANSLSTSGLAVEWPLA